MLQPFVREAGTGLGVVCVHSNASTSGQWRGLMAGVALIEYAAVTHSKCPVWGQNNKGDLR